MNEYTHTQNMPNTAHTAARERRSQGQTAGHTQLALRASTSLSPWEVTGALGCQQKEKNQKYLLTHISYAES